MSSVVVGVDGSAGAATALEWAAQEAWLRGLPLRVVHAYPTPLPVHLFTPAAHRQYEDSLRVAEQDARRMLDTMLAELGSGTAVPIRTEVTTGAASPALIDRSAGADLLVVGSRGRGGFAGLLLGSVSQQCVLHARCPVVVVPAAAARPAGQALPAQPAAVVVGTEGSPDSTIALRWAVAAARRRGAPLRVVHAYLMAGGPALVEHLAQHARAVLDAATDEASRQAPDLTVVGELVREAEAAPALLARAAEAALLVVGARGLGGFTGLLVGSVSLQCAHHAPCPVAILRAGPHRPDP